MHAFQPRFALNQPAVHVAFGAGVRHDLPAHLNRIGARRAVVIATPGQADAARALADTLGDHAAGCLPRARMHTPVDTTEAALAELTALRADALIALGGGSAIGLSKALALRTGLPQIALPTTHAGSEATAVLGETEAGRKTTRSDPRVQPGTILYDPELIVTLPLAVTIPSALNAIAHAAEGLYARDRTPLATLMATEGLRAFAAALPRVRSAPDDLDARAEALYGGWLCGMVLGQVGMALHHKLCHALGGSFGLPHAETHAILLPHTIGYTAVSVPQLLTPIPEIFGPEDTPGRALHSFARALDAPTALRDIGLRHADLARAVEIALDAPYWTPRPPDRDGLTALLHAAWDGAPPSH